ncbi:patatin-like phospholipase family protein [Thermosipho ferrireducens]|uniref:Patatin-like phospholipase family protein n=1 Tax=Thermosipho ferrireducens TaxID=2571116 RepID=A0ABX7S6A3_9BACT|nr:patatin-like phospholipase family protein [Thermosipho ferrireducens]QTA37403.1 patatin-like phospholipase family protein [Thermosipho ferrireducens]
MIRGVALAAGGVKGIAHIATLKYLEKKKLDFQIITGSSAGAIVAALYGLYGNSDIVRKKFFDAIEEFLPMFKGHMEKVEKSGVWSILQRSLVTIEEYYPFFKYLFGKKKFSDCIKNIGIVTFDTLNMESILITEGYLVDAVMASSSVPGVFSPLWIGGTQNTDGGVLSPTPVSEAISMGAEFVVASTFQRTPRKIPEDQLEIILCVDKWKEIEIEKVDLNYADVVIYYMISAHWFEFHKYKQIYEEALRFIFERRENIEPLAWW